MQPPSLRTTGLHNVFVKTRDGTRGMTPAEEHPMQQAAGRAWQQHDQQAFPQILQAVEEFLSFHGFKASLTALQEEQEGSLRRPAAGKEGRDRIRAELLRHFEQGQREKFFQVFHQYVPPSEEEAPKLEFRLQIYFAMFHLLPASSVLVAMPGQTMNRLSPGPRGGGSLAGALGIASPGRHDPASHMQALKAYLETRGAGLAHSGDFLLYYALPFISNPERHPSFEHLLRPEWAGDLRRDLKRYVDAMPLSNGIPALYKWFSTAEGDASPQGSPRHPGLQSSLSLESPLGPGPSHSKAEPWADLVADEPAGAPSALHAEPSGAARASHAGSVLQAEASNASQARHSNPGIPLPKLRVPASKSRIPPPPVSKPGITPQYPKPRHRRMQPRLSPTPRGSDPGLHSRGWRGLAPEGSGLSVIDEPQNADRAEAGRRSAARSSSQRPGMLAPLDYQELLQAVAQGAQEGASASGLAARLLQALRWRLVRSHPGNDRWEVLTTWIQVDLMGCYHLGPQGTETPELLKVVHTASLPLLVEAARLTNAIASDRLGRGYLLHRGSETITLLIALLKRGAHEGHSTLDPEAAQPDGKTDSAVQQFSDSVLLQQCLAALQKLSLKRQSQGQMLKQGLLQWLVTLLQDERLSQSTVESAFALLMNLCLRSAGQVACQQVAGPLLQLCTRLLESSNAQIRTYVHGILYSTLGRAMLRQEAQRQELPAKLQALQVTASEPFASQIQHILKQLQGPLRPSSNHAPDDSDDAAGEDKHVEEVYFDDDDAFADVRAAEESLEVEPGDLQGEPLLCSAYLAGSRQAQEQADMLRTGSLDVLRASLVASRRSTVAHAHAGGTAGSGDDMRGNSEAAGDISMMLDAADLEGSVVFAEETMEESGMFGPAIQAAVAAMPAQPEEQRQLTYQEQQEEQQERQQDRQQDGQQSRPLSAAPGLGLPAPAPETPAGVREEQRQQLHGSQAGSEVLAPAALASAALEVHGEQEEEDLQEQLQRSQAGSEMFAPGNGASMEGLDDEDQEPQGSGQEEEQDWLQQQELEQQQLDDEYEQEQMLQEQQQQHDLEGFKEGSEMFAPAISASAGAEDRHLGQEQQAEVAEGPSDSLEEAEGQQEDEVQHTAEEQQEGLQGATEADAPPGQVATGPEQNEQDEQQQLDQQEDQMSEAGSEMFVPPLRESMAASDRDEDQEPQETQTQEQEDQMSDAGSEMFVPPLRASTAASETHDAHEEAQDQAQEDRQDQLSTAGSGMFVAPLEAPMTMPSDNQGQEEQHETQEQERLGQLSAAGSEVFAPPLRASTAASEAHSQREEQQQQQQDQLSTAGSEEFVPPVRASSAASQALEDREQQAEEDLQVLQDQQDEELLATDMEAAPPPVRASTAESDVFHRVSRARTPEHEPSVQSLPRQSDDQGIVAAQVSAYSDVLEAAGTHDEADVPAAAGGVLDEQGADEVFGYGTAEVHRVTIDAQGMPVAYEQATASRPASVRSQAAAAEPHTFSSSRPGSHAERLGSRGEAHGPAGALSDRGDLGAAGVPGLDDASAQTADETQRLHIGQEPSGTARSSRGAAPQDARRGPTPGHQATHLKGDSLRSSQRSGAADFSQGLRPGSGTAAQLTASGQLARDTPLLHQQTLDSQQSGMQPQPPRLSASGSRRLSHNGSRPGSSATPIVLPPIAKQPSIRPVSGTLAEPQARSLSRAGSGSAPWPPAPLAAEGSSSSVLRDSVRLPGISRPSSVRPVASPPQQAEHHDEPHALYAASYNEQGGSRPTSSQSAVAHAAQGERNSPYHSAAPRSLSRPSSGSSFARQANGEGAFPPGTTSAVMNHSGDEPRSSQHSRSSNHGGFNI